MVYKGFRKPDLIFFLEVPVRVAVERLLSSRGVGYYSSGQDVGYKTKGVENTTQKYEQDMADRYGKIFKNESNVVRLDAARSIKEIAKDIKHELRKHLGLKEDLN
jgi:thymidylate kinase